MTLNTAFKQVFGEGLKEYWFVKAKCGYPIFGRCVNNGIVHAITFRKGYRSKDICIMCGVATVYRAEILLPEKKTEIDSVMYSEWFDRMYSFEGLHEQISIPYNDRDTEQAVIYALGQTERFILPELDKADSPAGCTEYYLKMQRFFSSLSLRGLYENKEFEVKYPKDRENEAMLWVLLNDRARFRDLCGLWLENMLRNIELWEKDGSWGNDLNEDRTSAEQTYTKSLAYYDKVFEDKEWLSKAHAELERRRAHNLLKLKEYGLITEEKQ